MPVMALNAHNPLMARNNLAELHGRSEYTDAQYLS